MMYSVPFTLSYLQDQDRDYRSRLGQFFTPNKIKTLCSGLLRQHKVSPRRILEPSAGTGEFIHTIQEMYPSSEVVALEKDPILKDHLAKTFSNITCIQGDFLKRKSSKYDLIVGNPPYFELVSDSPYRTLTYKEVLQNRSNVYALFIYRALQLLEKEGVLCFVVPESLKSSPSFSKLRKYIASSFQILEIRSLGNFSDDVLQSCMVFMCKNSIPDGRYYNQKTGIFSEDTKETKTIEDLDIVVKTGNVVWNQHKEKLTTDSNKTLLIYSDNIASDCLILRDHENKKQYISMKGKTVPVLLVSRSSGKTVKCLLYDGHTEYLCENHINEITGDIATLVAIEKCLKSEETRKYLNETVGTVNLSKTQLLQIPFSG